jgi:hypothetical protein
VAERRAMKESLREMKKELAKVRNGKVSLQEP